MSGQPKLWWHIAFRQQLVFLGMLLTFCGPMMGIVTYGIGQNETYHALAELQKIRGLPPDQQLEATARLLGAHRNRVIKLAPMSKN